MPVSEGIYYSHSGRDIKRLPPVLLIHGAGETNLSWPAEMRRLNGYRVIAVDLPGHGRSEETALQSIEAYANRIICFLESLKIPHAILVGHGMGGAIALQVCTQRSGMVPALGLVSSGAFLGGETGILEQLSTPFGFSKALQMIQESAFGLQADAGWVKDVMQALRRTRHGVLYSDWRASAAFDIRTEIEMIQVPTWVAVGSEDRLTPPSYAHFLVDHMPDAALQTIDGGGHMLPQQAGPELALGLRAFLERLEFRQHIADFQETLTSSEQNSQDNPNLLSMR